MFIDKMFNEYQVKMISSMGGHIMSLLKQGKFQEVVGAMSIARLVINLPHDISKDDDVKVKMIENIQRFEAGLIKKALL